MELQKALDSRIQKRQANGRLILEHKRMCPKDDRADTVKASANY
jgi:hypothetical protein